jgi:hypothetical protein
MDAANIERIPIPYSIQNGGKVRFHSMLDIHTRAGRLGAPLLWAAAMLACAGWPCATASAQECSNAGCTGKNGVPFPGTPCLYFGCQDYCTGQRFGEYAQPASPTCTTDDGRTGKPFCEFISNPDPTQDGQLNWSCPPSEPVRESGSLFPKYMILTVVYAPPGSQGCMFNSSASYGDGTTLGTTISASSSFNTETKISASVGAEVAGNGGEIGASFAFGQKDSNGSEMSVTNKSGSSIKASGPCSDGINHDYDRVYVLLGPEVPVEFADPAGCPNCGGETTSWSLAPNVGTQYEVYVGELKGTMEMRQSTSDIFAAHDINMDDQLAMLSADPLANWSGTALDEPDPSRFVRTTRSIAYAPPVPGALPDSHDYFMENESMTKSTEAAEFSYAVGLKVEGSAGFAGIAKAKLSVENNWTWTNSNSAAFSESRSTSAAVTIGSPSAAYMGPPAIAVYYDTIFKTYAFVPSF